MKDKIVSFNLLHPFQLILDEKKKELYQSYWLEPGLHIDIKRQMSTFVPICPRLLRELDRFRTIDWAIALRDLKYVPVLQRYLLLNEQGSIAVPG